MATAQTPAITKPAGAADSWWHTYGSGKTGYEEPAKIQPNLAFLRANPQVAYQRKVEASSHPTFFRNRYNDFYNRYQSQLGEMAANPFQPRGLNESNESYNARFAAQQELPRSFYDFLGGLDLDLEYAQTTSREKGFRTQTAAPRTRFLTGF